MLRPQPGEGDSASIGIGFRSVYLGNAISVQFLLSLFSGK